MNNRPLVPLSTDANSPFVLSPAMLLTQKSNDVCYPDSLGEFRLKDLYREEWKRVQVFSDRFWNQWRTEYLHTLQHRRKWHDERQNLKEGDVVLLRDKEVHRNQWPLGLVIDAIPSDSDGIVRKVQVRVVREGKMTTYTRPVTEVVLLVSE